MTNSIEIIIDFLAWQDYPAIPKRIEKGITLLLKEKKLSNMSVSLMLSSNEKIKELNKKFRKIDKETDVLSFEGQDQYLGDIIIAYQYAYDYSVSEGINFSDHIMHLALHGVLHLLGYDHEKDEDYKKMNTEEKHWLTKV